MVVGEVGVAIVRYFMCYVVAFQNPLRPRRSGEAYGTGSVPTSLYFMSQDTILDTGLLFPLSWSSMTPLLDDPTSR
jgi:hypothetical protein